MQVTEATTSRFAQTPRWRLHYNEVGTGHPLVLLHGSGPGASGWSNFAPNIAALAEHFRVLAVDMPGWGRSDTGDPLDRDHADALLALLDALDIERAAVVGNSMGGMTAVRFAVRYPERISHLVTMGTPAPGTNVFSPGGGQSEGLKILVDAYREPTPENFKRLVSVMTYDQRFATDELAAQRSANALAQPEHLSAYLAGAARGMIHAGYHELQSRLADVRTPTLVIHGRDDRTNHYEGGLRLTTLIANSRLLLLNRCGHWAQLEHAAEFNRLVTDFARNS